MRSIDVKTLVIIPTQGELDRFIPACRQAGFSDEDVLTGRLSLTRFPAIGLAVACGGLGKAQFAVHTQHLIEQGQWELVICAGAAGALVEGLSIGDVVIATETVEHDIRNRFGPPLVPRFRSSDAVLERCRSAVQTGDAFRVHYGPIASGDEDVVDTERRATIHTLTGALVVAWEGAGGARASRFNGVPFIEIRGVTDRADRAAAVDFKSNLKRAMNSVARVVTCLAGQGASDIPAGATDQAR